MNHGILLGNRFFLLALIHEVERAACSCRENDKRGDHDDRRVMIAVRRSTGRSGSGNAGRAGIGIGGYFGRCAVIGGNSGAVHIELVAVEVDIAVVGYGVGKI